MAEFCLECLNKMNNTNYTEEDLILSDDLDFCERCKKQKKVVVTRQNSYKTSSCVYSFTIFDLWDILLDTILKIIKIIYKIYKIIKKKK